MVAPKIFIPRARARSVSWCRPTMMSLALTASAANSGLLKEGRIDGIVMSLSPRCTMTPVAPVTLRTSRSNRAAPLGSAEVPQQPAAADSLVDHRKTRPRRIGVEPRGQEVRPGAVQVADEPAPCVSGIAECHQRADRLRRQHFHGRQVVSRTASPSHPADPRPRCNCPRPVM